MHLRKRAFTLEPQEFDVRLRWLDSRLVLVKRREPAIVLVWKEM